MDGQVNAANKAAIIVGEANDTVITDCNSSGQVRASGVLGGSQEPSALPLPRHSKQQACLSAILRGGGYLVTVPSVDYGTLSVMESQNNYAKEINADPVQLTATVVPDSAANKNVVWNVKDTDGSSTDVIFVDDKGTLTVNREAKWI